MDKQILNIGKFKKAIFYQAPIECSDETFQAFVTLGKKVVTDNDYFHIAIIKTLTDAANENLKDKQKKK